MSTGVAQIEPAREVRTTPAGSGGAGLRKLLERRRERTLVRGRSLKADLWIARLGDGTRVVVKDFQRKPLVGRVWGRLQVWREERLLRAVGDLDVVPRLIGRLGSLALLIEHRRGGPLHRIDDPKQARLALDALSDALDALHGRGVLHNDLRGRGNLHFDPEQGRLTLLDWAGGVVLRPGSVIHRLFFRRARLVDESARLKWQGALLPGSLSAGERAFLDRFARWRRLWPFNRKSSRGPRRDGRYSTKYPSRVRT